MHHLGQLPWGERQGLLLSQGCQELCGQGQQLGGATRMCPCVVVSTAGIYNVEIRQEFLGEHLGESNASAPDWRLSPALQCLALLVASLGPQSALCYKGAWGVPFEFFIFWLFCCCSST